MKIVIFTLTVGILSFSACKNSGVDLPTPDPQVATTNATTNSSTSTKTDDKTTNGVVTIVPDNIKSAIAAKYPGYVIYESILEESYWQTLNRVTIRLDKSKIILLYTPTWVYVGIRN
jgi:hypothetical protein